MATSEENDKLNDTFDSTVSFSYSELFNQKMCLCMVVINLSYCAYLHNFNYIINIM